MIIRDIVAAAASRLKAARIPEHRMEAELLLAHLMKRDLAWMIAHDDAAVSPQRAKAFAKLVTARARRVPFAYLIGEKGFYGRVFRVTKDVLIPRPATETLIEAVLARAPAKTTFIDIGTGSGAIGLTLAAERPESKAVLYDISKRALAVAKANARRLKLGRRTRAARHDLLKGRLPEPKGQSVLVANLPYLSQAELRHTKPEVRLHEPKLALVSGKDGLDHYRALFKNLVRWKRKPVLLAIEGEPGQFQKLAALARGAMPDARIEILNDLHGDERVLVAQNQNAP